MFFEKKKKIQSSATLLRKYGVKASACAKPHQILPRLHTSGLNAISFTFLSYYCGDVGWGILLSPF